MEKAESEIRESIEETGKIFEKFDLTPMQGRIMAFLIISDEPEKTFDELVKYFKASKSSISNSLSYLLQIKIVDYKTYASDRRRYFFVTDIFFRVYFKRLLENVNELKTQAIRIVSLRSPDHRGVNEYILKWIENANLFEQKLSETISSFDEDI
jgi:DNA-binding transcriptional regulator GbsR (MarR family)